MWFLFYCNYDAKFHYTAGHFYIVFLKILYLLASLENPKHQIQVPSN